MKRRVFIAILLPEKVKRILADFQRYLREYDVRWIKPENLHLTLFFLGWLEENQIVKAKESLKSAINGVPSFELELSQIQIGPSLKLPRMIWVTGPVKKELEETYQKIKKNLADSRIPFDGRYALNVHITLARAEGGGLKGKKIQETINSNFPVKEIFLMESCLKSSGAEYQVLGKFSLK
ncbi:MAG: RNA 2',3'-cyclic phosphodiesterase [Patescibacteria group bacterium]